MSAAPTASNPPSAPRHRALPDATFYTRRHLRLGWWSLLVFLSLGVALESMHGFKIGWYLDVSQATRRLMFTLAHAHGALLALVHLAFAAAVAHLPTWNPRWRHLASNGLTAGGLLIPAGFFLGGVIIHAGDPGLGIVLVPLGALLLFLAVFLTARAASRAGASQGQPQATRALK